MRLFSCFLIAVLFLLPDSSIAQNCTALGQNPSTAFPVCGTSTFTQTSVPTCGVRPIPVNCNDGALYRDKNPFWYKFTCYTAGTLGFALTPMVLSDDYDWQLFDVTNRAPDEVYTDPTLFVGCNWSFASGVTGASTAGVSALVCSADPNTFSTMPVLIVGHQYLLLISHFTNTQSGYQLSFGGGTANITDPNVPLIQSATANCDGTSIVVRFTKPLKCNSLAQNGSDFTISPSGTVTAAVGFGCTAGFTFDSITLTLSTPLASGNHTVVAANGSDGNTLLDNCDLRIPVGNNTAFTIQSAPPVPMGTVVPVGCSPSTLTLQLPTPIRCNSVAANGSDFTISGPSTVSVTGATATCNTGGQTTSITLQLAAPISVDGNYQLTIATGTDGNTLAGNCSSQVTVGASAPFVIAASPVSQLTGVASLKCTPTSIRIGLNAKVQCSSIAPNGSDFTVTGPVPVNITGAAGICVSGLADSIDVQFSSAIVRGGSYQLQLVTGSDGNTLLSECNRQSPPSSIPFTAFDTVSAAFTNTVQSDCNTNTVVFTHSGGNLVSSWNWTVDGAAAGAQSTLTQVLPATTNAVIRLTVSNGTCSATRTETMALDNKVTVNFIAPDFICPDDSASFVNQSTGPIDSWLWNFGNGNTSTLQDPPVQGYPVTGSETSYTVTLTASNAQGCQDMKTETVKVLSNCIIAVPTGFTPNNDGLNDYFYPLNAFKAEELDFKVYNRWGELVFATTDWQKKWDGKFKGVEQATGVFAWILSYKDKTTGRRYSLKGTTVLMR